MRACITANCEIRDNGTFAYVRQALKQVMGLPVHGLDPEHMVFYMRGHPLPKDAPHFDFTLFCDDGRDDIPMEVPAADVTACYLIDTHLGGDIRLQWAKHFDYVFCAQQPGAQAMAAAGLNAYWLPLACQPQAHPNVAELLQIREALTGMQSDPEQQASAQASLQQIFMGEDLSKKWDCVFVGFMNRGVDGHPHSHNRVEYLDAIFKAYRNSWLVTNCFHEAMAARYVKGRVGVNLSILRDLNMRAFEIPSTGTAMLANRDVDGLGEVGFVEGKHFVGYEGIDEAIEQIRWMLDNPMEREAIAKTGHELVRSQHTYAHRMAAMFETCGIDIAKEMGHGQDAEGEADAGVAEQDAGIGCPEPERADRED